MPQTQYPSFPGRVHMLSFMIFAPDTPSAHILFLQIPMWLTLSPTWSFFFSKCCPLNDAFPHPFPFFYLVYIYPKYIIENTWTYLLCSTHIHTHMPEYKLHEDRSFCQFTVKSRGLECLLEREWALSKYLLNEGLYPKSNSMLQKSF